MKKFILIASLIVPTLSIAMETKQDTQPPITLTRQKFSSLLERYYSSPDHSSRQFSYTIKIPEGGAKFELSTRGLGFFPDNVRLEIKEGTQHISIISKDNNFFAIKNDRDEELAQLIKLKKAD